MEENSHSDIPLYRRSDVFQPGHLPLDLVRQQQHPPMPLHKHEFSELVITLRGYGIHQTSQGDYPIGAGDVFVLHPYQEHGYHHTENLEIVNVLFVLDELLLPPADISLLPGYHALFDSNPFSSAPFTPASIQCVQHPVKARFRLSLDKLMEISWLLERLEQEISRRETGGDYKSIAYFMLLIASLSQSYTRALEPPAKALFQFGRVLSHMEQFYAEPLSLEQLAQIGCVSVRSLSRGFKENFGCSPIDYLIHIRVRYATKLLQHFDLSITEVALQCGFQDSNYFARKFRELLGITPRDFRKQQQALKKAFSQSHTQEHSSLVGGRFWENKSG